MALTLIIVARRLPRNFKIHQHKFSFSSVCNYTRICWFVVLWQVSLLEYRNRSRNRLSVDAPRTLPSQSAGVTSVTNGSSSSSLSHLVMKSPSLPNLSSPSTTPSFVHRPISSSGEMNGPHVEPVSPDMEEKSTGRDDCIDEKALSFFHRCKIPGVATPRVTYNKVK